MLHKSHEYYEMKYSGVVKGLHEDYEDKKLVRLEIEPTDTPKKKKKKGEAMAYMETRSETISMEMSAMLKLGDRVEVVTMVRKTRKKGQPQLR